ncbi:ribonuclease III [Rhodohalobacter sulfatireducens]|uniref:Ribonuclease 3 n=1 Tax=Rhodohalobacter sulfatireducens TaxID=2911366 RepID=A0ABS9KF60_9BACT|nr:ribonuclease III [Rhodohalobacter sulfatireducens]MCG2589496.1 ribonuclease III [Rhodohalobacter sulfatireducens]
MLYRLKKWLWKDKGPIQSESRERLQKLENTLDLTIPSEYQQLFQKALRHKSIVDNDKFESYETYERLEFLGDAVLDLIVTEILFEKYPKENEGFLTKLRAKIVRGDTLFEISKKLGLSEFLEIGERAAGQGIELSKSVLSDVYEALVAAIYISSGYDSAHRFVSSHIDRFIDFKQVVKVIDNYKSLLMEYSQSEKLKLPNYQVISEEGPGHNKTFYVAVFIENKKLGEGTGKSKKKAEQEAARNALEALGEK